MPTDKVLGIDLGTTNSACAVVEGDDPKIIPNAEGGRTTPSVVSITENGEWLVGDPAVNQEIQNPEHTVRSVKRKIGREGYTETIRGTEYTPEELSAAILRKLKRDSERYLGETVSRAVITVPAYFSDRQRQATKDAGEIAGLSVERIVNEPTAAAMAYGLKRERSQSVLVVDLGGGTFDVSILELGDGIYDVIATNGDNQLGGDDWDEALVAHALDRFESAHGIDLREDPRASKQLKNACEDLKRSLTARTEAQLNIPFITTRNNEPLDINFSISRERFEQLTDNLHSRLTDPIQRGLDDAGISGDQLDTALLIGGATRMPKVEAIVNEMVGPRPQSSVNPDEAVALGAAVQAAVIAGHKENLLLLDVTPKSLGIEVKGGLFEPLIERNTTIPTKASKIYTTSENDQSSVYIRVYQGEQQIADRNELLGEFELTGIPPAEAGTPAITVEFAIDANGIVDVSAEDAKSGSTESIRIEGGTGLSDTEIETMKQQINSGSWSSPKTLES